MTVFMDTKEEGGASVAVINGGRSIRAQKDNAMRIEKRRLERHPNSVMRLLAIVSNRNSVKIIGRIPLRAA
jgi:hypothetical protein